MLMPLASAPMADPSGPFADPLQVAILFISEPQDPPLLENEMFLRQLGAMRLADTERQVWELAAVDLAVREKDISDDWVVVSFSEKLAEWLSLQRPRLNLIKTYSPAECAQRPALKRQVWDDLKRAMEKAGLSSRLQS